MQASAGPLSAPGRPRLAPVIVIESTTTGILEVVLGGSGLLDLGAGLADSGSERSY